VRRILPWLIAGAALVLAWQILALALGPRQFPQPLSVFFYLKAEISGPIFWGHFSKSSLRALAGLSLGFFLACPLGIFLGWHKRADRYLAPLLFLTYPVPKILLLPILMTTLGLGESPKIILLALTSGYQILLVTRDGIKSLDQACLDSFASIMPSRNGRPIKPGLRLWALFRHLLWPAALPAALTSLRLASGTAIAVLFMAESFASEEGLGFLIIEAWGAMDLPRMFSGILCMSLLGIIFYGLIGLLERLLCPWASPGMPARKGRDGQSPGPKGLSPPNGL
jgi:NitT/TauT family transport system permease protein